MGQIRGPPIRGSTFLLSCCSIVGAGGDMRVMSLFTWSKQKVPFLASSQWEGEKRGEERLPIVLGPASPRSSIHIPAPMKGAWSRGRAYGRGAWERRPAG